MDDIVTKADIRRQQATRRVGPNGSCCICGENDPRCIELHHIAGQHYDGQLVPVCRNCHRKLSDVQRDHPPQIETPPSFVEVVGHYLLGLADLLRLVADRLVEFGKSLIAKSTQIEGAAQ
jgi:hypothetical protein